MGVGIRSPDLLDMMESIGGHLWAAATPGIAIPARVTPVGIGADFGRKDVFRFTSFHLGERCCAMLECSVHWWTNANEPGAKNISPRDSLFLPRGANKKFVSDQRHRT